MMISTLEEFFSANPFVDSFPRASVVSDETTASGVSTVTLSEVTADTDGRPLLVIGACFAYVVASASGGTSWSYRLQRDNSTIASIGSSLALNPTRADGFLNITGLDAPSGGRYIYKLTFQSNSAISDYRFKHRSVVLMDRLT